MTDNNQISLGVAFFAGVISFLSPCVLPLIPGYLSFVSGVSAEEMRLETKPSALNARIFFSALFFVLGFSAVFILLGASATGIGKFLVSRLAIFSKIAGVLIILLGLHVTGIFKWDFLLREKKIEIRKKGMGWPGCFIVGATFAFGWTPCIGPILAGILTYAGTRETVLQGVALLTLYSLGLGVPFLLTALSVPQFFRFFGKVKRWLHGIEIASGLLLIAIGVLIFTDRLTLLANSLSFLNRFSL